MMEKLKLIVKLITTRTVLCNCCAKEFEDITEETLPESKDEIRAW
jgi:hypothetical protein